MLRDFWRRPAVVIGAWTMFFLAVFIWRGDLGITSGDSVQQQAQQSTPVIVRPEKRGQSKAERTLQRGRVFDSLGYLLVGAEVVPMQREAARTDADGSFRLELDADSWTDVLVRATGQQSKWMRVAAGSPDSLVVRLEPQAPWDQAAALLPPAPMLRGEGNARTHDGRPLVNGFVTAIGTGIWARTDELGRFVVPLTSPVATLLLHQPDALNGEALLASPIATGRTQGLVPLPELAAEPAGSVHGIVRDAEGAPVAGVPVRIRSKHIDRVIETGSSGAFHLAGLLPGAYHLEPFAFRGAVGVTSDVTIDRPLVECDLQLRSATEKRLRVIDEGGAAVASVFVVASSEGVRRGVTQADADGWASLPVAADTTFDVRTPVAYAPMQVRRFESDAATLVVAAP